MALPVCEGTGPLGKKSSKLIAGEALRYLIFEGLLLESKFG